MLSMAPDPCQVIEWNTDEPLIRMNVFDEPPDVYARTSSYFYSEDVPVRCL